MIGPLVARWLLTAVFAFAALGAALPLRGRAGRAAADRAAAVFSPVMCAALIAMAWWSEPAAAAWSQAAVFGCAALWFGLGGLGGSCRAGRLSPAGLHHALMAGVTVWMLAPLPGAAGMPSPRPGHGAMAGMSGAGVPGLVLAVSIVLAGCCAAASIPWLALAMGPGPRVKDPAAASQAATSAGMAAMLIVML